MTAVMVRNGQRLEHISRVTQMGHADWTWVLTGRKSGIKEDTKVLSPSKTESPLPETEEAVGKQGAWLLTC